MNNDTVPQETPQSVQTVEDKNVSARDVLHNLSAKLSDMEQRELARHEQINRIENTLTALSDKANDTASTIDFLQLISKNLSEYKSNIDEIIKRDATKDLIDELASFRKIINTTLNHIPNVIEESNKKQEQLLTINNKSVDQNNKIIEDFTTLLKSVNNAEILELTKLIEVANKNVTLSSDLMHNTVQLKTTTPNEGRRDTSWLKTLLKKR